MLTFSLICKHILFSCVHVKAHIAHFTMAFYNPNNQDVVKLTWLRQYALAYNIFPLNKRI